MSTTTLQRPGAVVQLRVAIYCRVSTQEQGEHGYSLGGQLAECRALTEQLGARVVLERQEVGSGADWNLPDLLDLLDRAKAGEYDVLICLATSRLARELAKLAVVERQLKQAGVQIRYVHQQYDDSPAGQFSRNVMSAVDQFERANIALRFALGKRAKAARGLALGIGPAAYGYRPIKNERGRTVGFEIDRETAPVVARIFRDVLTTPLYQLAEALNAEGIRAPHGGLWHRNTVSGIVRNPVYTGRAAYGRRAYRRVQRPDGVERETFVWRDESEVLYAEVPAVVTPKQAEAAKAAIVSRQVRRAGRQPDQDTYTLRGMLTCGLCHGPLACSISKGNRKVPARYYECLRHRPYLARSQRHEGCSLPVVPADDAFDDQGHPRGIEAEAWQVIRHTLLDREHLRAGLAELRKANKAAERRRDQVNELSDEIASWRKRLDRQTLELLAADPGSEAEQSLRRAAREIERTIGRLNAALGELEAAPIDGLGDETSARSSSSPSGSRAGWTMPRRTNGSKSTACFASAALSHRAATMTSV